MTITNIGTLQTAAESWAERTLDDALFLQWANAVARKLMHGMLAPDNRTWIVPPLRYKAMEETDQLTTSGASVALPGDWLEFKRIWIDQAEGHPDLTYYPLTQFKTHPDSVQSGTPTKYTIDGGNLYTAPTSDAELQVTYYTALGGFSADASTDAVLTANPEVYLSGVLCEYYRWARDEGGLAMEQAEFGAKVRGLNAQDKTAQTSGSILVQRPQAVA